MTSLCWPPPPSHVPTHCFYSTGVSTPEIFKYSEDFPEITEPEVGYGEEGDRQVSKKSCEVCLRWFGASSYPFQAHHYPGIHHVDLFQDDNVLKEIGDVVPNTCRASTAAKKKKELAIKIRQWIRLVLELKCTIVR